MSSGLYGNRPIITVSGTSKPFDLKDSNTLQLCTNGSTVTLTVPDNATFPHPIGTEIDVLQMGNGQVVFVETGGVLLVSAFSNRKVAAQYTGASLKKIDTDSWVLFGNLTA